MIFGSGVLLLLFPLLMGQGGDLLDLLSTEDYWKAKGVQVSVDQLLAEIEPPKAADIGGLIKDLGSPEFAVRDMAAKKIMAMGQGALTQLEQAATSPDPEVANAAKELSANIQAKGRAAAVRRLMAIRTLGEMKEQKALPPLNRLLEAQEMFVADYAARAIGLIEGKPVAYKMDVEAAKADLAMLPAGCGIVGQINRTGGEPVTLESLLSPWAKMPADMGGGAARLDQVRTQAVAQIIDLAEKIGNVRFDGATFAFSEDVDGARSFGVILIRGLYDPVAIIEQLRGLSPDMKSEQVEGVTVLRPANEPASLVAVSSRRFAIIRDETGRNLSVAEVLRGIQTGKGAIGGDVAMSKLVAGIDPADSATLVIKVSESLRGEVPHFKAIDNARFRATSDKGMIDIKMEAQGADAKAVGEAVESLRAEVKAAITQVEAASKDEGMFAKMVPADVFAAAKGFLESVLVKADGGKVIGSARLDGGKLMGGAGLLFGMAVPQPPPVAPDVVVDEKEPAKP